MGRPTELLLRALVPSELTMAKPTRLIQVGEAAGSTLTLAAESLRTSGVELYGVARGLDPTTMMEAYQQVVQWAQAGTLTFDLERVPLSQIQTAWQRPICVEDDWWSCPTVSSRNDTALADRPAGTGVHCGHPPAVTIVKRVGPAVIHCRRR